VSDSLYKKSWLPLLIVVAIVLATFAPGLWSGFYMDDHSFLMTVRQPAAEVWDYFLHYVPGRNLQIFFFWILAGITNQSALWLHRIILLGDALSAILAYLLAWELTALPCVALPIALIFALLPNHGETHFWFTQFVQCEIPTLLCLLAFWLAARRKTSLPRRLFACLGLYIAALFTYDQVFFLWPLLLMLLWFRSSPQERRPRVFLMAAALVLSLNLTHVLMRHFSEKSFGGRPVIQWKNILLRLPQSILEPIKGMFSLPSPGRLSHWGWTAALTAAALLTGWLIARLVRRWAEADRPSWDAWRVSPAPLRLMFFGCAWFFLAYLPNYFWYMNPRHNYLPSLGWAFLCVGTAVWLIKSRPLAGRTLTVLSVLLFANAVVANVHEGSEWAYTHRLHQAYLKEAARFFPDFENIFVIGAPRYVKKAPAFHLYHDAPMAAIRAAGRKNLVDGDYQLTPTREGAFYLNDLSIWNRSTFRWLPYSRINAVAYISGTEFRCIREVRMRDPQGRAFERETRPVPGCQSLVRLDMAAALDKVEEKPASARSGSAVPGMPGLELAEVALQAKPELLRLDLGWIARRSQTDDFVVLLTVYDNRSRVLYEPVYPSPTLGRKTPVLWPLFNDQKPPSSWRAGRAMRESYVLRTKGTLPIGPCRVRLEIYSIGIGRNSRKIGETTVSSEIRDGDA